MFESGLGRKPKYYAGQSTEYKKIVSDAGANSNGSRLFMWECSLCGKGYGPSTGTDIFKSVRTKCCPLQKEQKRNYRGHGFITGKKMTDWQQNAKKKGRRFDVDARYLVGLWEQQEGRCWYSGIALEYGKNASLDRTNSDLNYVPGNVRWVHIDVNWMKRNFSEEEFLEFCKMIANNPRFNNS